MPSWLPDRMIFDLDPGEQVPWEQVQEAALLTRTLLQELGLKSWLKTCATGSPNPPWRPSPRARGQGWACP
ncbi:MAG TPA: hypothetical protein VNS31_04545 [Ramlibacter sp.]|nr:hypothetical protein [Ramlibacter sp.]